MALLAIESKIHVGILFQSFHTNQSLASYWVQDPCLLPCGTRGQWYRRRGSKDRSLHNLMVPFIHEADRLSCRLVVEGRLSLSLYLSILCKEPSIFLIKFLGLTHFKCERKSKKDRSLGKKEMPCKFMDGSYSFKGWCGIFLHWSKGPLSTFFMYWNWE
jgi:hypothetical protein